MVILERTDETCTKVVAMMKMRRVGREGRRGEERERLVVVYLEDGNGTIW